MRISSLIMTCLAGAILAGASEARAQVELKNDGFENDGQAAFQSGFVAGEIGASRFIPPAGGVSLLSVQFLLGGAADLTDKMITLRVWDDGGLMTAPGAELYAATYSIKPSETALQQIDLTAENVVVDGPFRVGIEFQHDGLPSIARDDDGTIAGDLNFIQAKGLGWSQSDKLGVSGDWILRAFVEEGEGGSGGGGGGSGGGGVAGGGGMGGMGAATGSGGGGGAGGSGGSGCTADSECPENGTCSDGQCIAGGDDGGCGCRAAGSEAGGGAVLSGSLLAAILRIARRARSGRPRRQSH